MNLNDSPTTLQFSAVFEILGDITGTYSLNVGQDGEVRLEKQRPEDGQSEDDDIDSMDIAPTVPPQYVTVGVFDFTPDYTPRMVASETEDINTMLDALMEFWLSTGE